MALLCLSYSASNNSQELVPGQIYNTGNVVLPTNPGGPVSWTNGVYQDNLTCWAWGNPGYCGPNAIVRPGNNVNFSFGLTHIYQEQNVALLLPKNSTGLQVNGFNFGFTAKNGNGWDDGRLDQLSAVVRFWDTTGNRNTNNAVEKYDYSLNYRFNWTTFNFSETFATPRDVTTIGNVQYGFIGKDNNNWAGPYGPEVTNISFSLRYSVDPCVSNPISSPTCPGYLQTISRFTNSTPTGSIDSTLSTTSVAMSTVPSLMLNANTIPVTVEIPVTTATTSSSTTTSTPTLTASSASNTSATPSATNPQPRVGEVAISGSPAQTTSSQSSMSLSQALNIVRAEQNRVSRLETSAVATAVEQATRESEKVVNEAQSVAAVQQAQVAANNESATNALVAAATTPTPSLGSGLQVGPAGVPQIGLLVRDPVTGTQIASLQSNNSVGEIATTTSNVGTTEPTMISVTRKQELQEAVSQQTSESSSSSPVFSATNPLNNYVNPPASSAEAAPVATGPVVNRNVQPNSAAGGRDITVIATAPPGFDAYTTGTVPDGAFYAPREIYRNQRTVDNARAQRALSGGSDRLHREMIDRQYRIQQ